MQQSFGIKQGCSQAKWQCEQSRQLQAAARAPLQTGRALGSGRRLPPLLLPPPPRGLASRAGGRPGNAPTSWDEPHRESYSRPGYTEAVDDVERWMERLSAMPPTTRSVALQQLLRIDQEGAYSGLVGGSPGAGTDVEAILGHGPREKKAAMQRLDPRHQRGVTEMVNGVTRWRRRLDYVLDKMSSQPIAELDAPLRLCLRMSLYEMLELKVQSFAAVNEYVELLKAVQHRGVAGVANGLLRNAARALEFGTLPQPPAPVKGMSQQEAAEALALGASHPTWMVQGWLEQYGAASTMALLRTNNERPRYALRVAPHVDTAELCRQLAQQEVEARPSAFMPREFIVVESGMQAVLASGLVEQGDGQVQDEAAGLVVAMLDPRPGDTILDGCAAPGGKTLFAAARMGGKGRILALDLFDSRLAALRDMARRQEHARCVRTMAVDMRQYSADVAQRQATAAAVAAAAAAAGPSAEQEQRQGQGEGPADSMRARRAEQYSGIARREGGGGPPVNAFDRVLVDAPCSGTGVLSKRADLRWRRTPQQVDEVVLLQSQLLDAAAQLVVPGGLLVYSTCSIERRENEDQIASFLTRHPDFQVSPPPEGIPKECLSEEGFLSMLPHVHGTDGAFAARLQRRGGGGSTGASDGAAQ